MRLVASLQAGVVAPCVLLKKLAAYPRQNKLDLALQELGRIERTLFIASSKSGGTTETMSHVAYFWEEAAKAGLKKPEEHFAAITDVGTPLEELAAARDFRWVFLNPADIGGRYSALSYFGLVPGALMGVDVRELLERAQEMASACEASVPVEKNPGIWLGAAVRRAEYLERLLPYRITRHISGKFKGWEALVLGVLIYVFLLFMNGLVFFMSFEPSGTFDLSWNASQCWVKDFSIVAIVFILIVVFATWLHGWLRPAQQ